MSGGAGGHRGIPRPARPPAVAGMFYPDDPADLGALVDDLLASARAGAHVKTVPGEVQTTGRTAGLTGLPALAGILVPHAGLVYSGLVAATAWRLFAPGTGQDSPAPSPSPRMAGQGSAAPGQGSAAPGQGSAAPGQGSAAPGQGSAAPGQASPAPGQASPAPGLGSPAPAPGSARPTFVLLGTNHSAGWLTSVGAWDGGPWRTPLGEVEVDVALTEAVLGLGTPFVADARCHLGEHSLEVQLPLLRRVASDARIVALSVGTGRGPRAIEAGRRLGSLLAARRAAGVPIVLAISTDMAHYPPATVAERITATLLPHIVGLDSERLADAESAVTLAGERGVSCGMCGIEPSVLGLAALRAMGARPGVALAAATSADAGGDPRRTVGYLAVGFAGS